MRNPIRIALVFLLFTYTAVSAALGDQDIQARVDANGADLTVTVSMFVHASPADVWSVLIDYDNATKFISDLEESRIIERNGNVMRVRQRSIVRFGPISIPIESVREVRLSEPTRIDAHQISGTLPNTVTRVDLAVASDGTILTYRAHGTNSVFVPNSFVQHEAERKFAELRREIMRRSAGR